jgi:protein-disulfide isomerase
MKTRVGHAVRVDRSRLYLLVAAALGAAAVVVVLIVVGTSGSSGSSSSARTVTSDTGTTASSTGLSLAGIPQHGATLGRASAPATIEVFEDPQCPYCQEWNLETLPTVVREYVRTGKVKLVYRGIEIIGPNSENGLRANYAAGEQNKLWQMSDELYARQGEENSGWIDDATIASAAKSAGVDVDALSAAMPTAPVTNMLKAAAAAATRYAVAGTPTFVVQVPPALPTQLQLAALDPASFSAALDPLLK